MALDKELEEAVRSVVAEAKQPSAVAQRLIAWLKELSETDLGPEDKSRHLDNLRGALDLSGDAHED
jgi:hypothetical protein